MPGSTPATSQLDWLSSTTAMIVLSWSKATRDLLKSFSWGIGALRQLFASDDGAISFAACPIPSLRWREMDSNFRFLVVRPSNRHGRRDCCLENGSGSVGEPKVRIHLPPALSPLRTWLAGGKRGKVRGDDKGRTELAIAAVSLNRMLELGRPEYVRLK